MDGARRDEHASCGGYKHRRGGLGGMVTGYQFVFFNCVTSES